MSQLRDIWPLANSVIRTARQMVNRRLQPLGLSSAEGNILFHLLTQARAMSQEEIVAQLDISKPAVSRALDTLEAKGYVSRARDSVDRRVNRVTLTDRAHSAAASIEQVYAEVIGTAASAVTPAEAAEFIDVFRRVSAVLTAATQDRQGE
jgi:MarR family transcriptional regulator for hemolysin